MTAELTVSKVEAATKDTALVTLTTTWSDGSFNGGGVDVRMPIDEHLPTVGESYTLVDEELDEDAKPVSPHREGGFIEGDVHITPIGNHYVFRNGGWTNDTRRGHYVFVEDAS